MSYCSLNNVNQYGYIKKTKNASQIGLNENIQKYGSVYFCGRNDVISNNQYMQHVWKSKKQLNVNVKFKSCFSDTHYNGRTSYYLITQKGQLYVGGQADYYILGIYSSSDKNSFQRINQNYNWKKVIGRYSCDHNYDTVYFLTQDGRLFFSGRQGYAFYWDGGYKASESLIRQPQESGIIVDDIQCMYGGSLILDKNGYIYAKGYNRNGQLGNGQSGTSNNNQMQYYYQAVHLENELPTNDWIKIAAGWNTCYAINKKGELYSWGSNEYGQLGIGKTITNNTDNDLASTPQLIANGQILFDDVSAGSHHMICKDKQGNIYTCGLNEHGQLGDGTTTNRNSLTKIFSNINARKVVAGQCASAIIDVIGGCYCVGYSNNTIIHNYTGNVLEWLKLGFINNITYISMCADSFCLIGE